MDTITDSCMLAVHDITRRQALSGTAADANRMQVALIGLHRPIRALQFCECE